MWPGELPGRVDPRAAEEVRGRWNRASRWVRLMVLWCHAAAALAVLAVLWQWLRLGVVLWEWDPSPLWQWGGRADDSSLFGQLLVLAVAIVPLVIAARVAKRHVDGIDWRLKPDEWLYYGLFIGICEAPPLLYALNSFTGDGLPAWAWLPVGVVAAGIPLAAGYAARRAMLARPLREVGGSEVVLLLDLRSRGGKGGDSVKLTADRLRLSAVNAAGGRPGAAAVKDLDVRTITGIGVRRSTPEDAAWARLPDGRGASPHPGQVVVVRTRDDEQLLPADAEFAEVLRARVALHGREPAGIEFEER